MKFDLIDAMTTMKKNFGNDGEILVWQSDDKIFVRLCSLFNSGLLSYQFEIERAQIKRLNVNLFNYHFRSGIAELKYKMRKA